MGGKRIYAKDFHYLLKNINGMSGGQAAVTDWEEDLSSIKVTITPSDGYYKGGQFTFEIKGDATDFSNPPRVNCQTMIYHPNIDTLEDDGEICLNLFEDLWTKEMNLEDVVQGLLFLLYNPNLEDPLTCIFSPNMSEEEFAENVKISIEGGCIDGYNFTKHKINLGDDGDEEGKGGDGKEGDSEVRGEPDGAEEVGGVEETPGENEKVAVIDSEESMCLNNNVIKDGLDHQGDVLQTSSGMFIMEENERIDRIECNIYDEDDDDGTPVDGYPHAQINDDVKMKKDVTAGNGYYRRQDSKEVKPDPGRRMNFWWAIAIRRVRGWNVFS